jgi:hypothetical protein
VLVVRLRLPVCREAALSALVLIAWHGTHRGCMFPASSSFKKSAATGHATPFLLRFLLLSSCVVLPVWRSRPSHSQLVGTNDLAKDVGLCLHPGHSNQWTL